MLLLLSQLVNSASEKLQSMIESSWESKAKWQLLIDFAFDARRECDDDEILPQHLTTAGTTPHAWSGLVLPHPHPMIRGLGLPVSTLREA